MCYRSIQRSFEDLRIWKQSLRTLAPESWKSVRMLEISRRQLQKVELVLKKPYKRYFLSYPECLQRMPGNASEMFQYFQMVEICLCFNLYSQDKDEFLKF